MCYWTLTKVCSVAGVDSTNGIRGYLSCRGILRVYCAMVVSNTIDGLRESPLSPSTFTSCLTTSSDIITASSYLGPQQSPVDSDKSAPTDSRRIAREDVRPSLILAATGVSTCCRCAAYNEAQYKYNHYTSA